MDWIFDDGGRALAGFKGVTGDCAARAIAIAANMPYQKVYDDINAFASRERKGKRKRKISNARTGVFSTTVRKYMASLDWYWIPTMHIGSGCTVHLRASELPAGRLVCRVSHHYTAVINGVIHDIYDPSAKGTTIYPLSISQDLLPKGAYRLSNGNGYAYSPERCVYGYWIKKSFAENFCHAEILRAIRANTEK